MNNSENVISLPFVPKDRVREEIERIARNETSNLDVLDHAIGRMEERDVSMKQVLNVLKNGDQVGDITWCSENERGWRCKLSRVTGGSSITVVAKLVKREDVCCLVVTTWEN